jgi:hypothetical protein
MDLTQNQTYIQPAGFFKRLTIIDWLYAAALLAASLFALNRFGTHMDYYEKIIVVMAAPADRLAGRTGTVGDHALWRRAGHGE